VKPVVVAAPAVVKPAVVPPAASLKDLPAEKPSSWKDIAQANGIANPNRIMPGQTLKIPGRADYVVKPGDTLADIAAGQTKAPKSAPSAGDTQPAAAAVLKKYPNLGTLAPIPRDVLKDLGMDAQTKKEIAKYGREELLTPAIIKKQNYSPTPAQAQAALRANEKANTERIAARDAERAANRKKVKEDDIEEQTMDDGFKWGSPTMPMQDGSVHKYNPQTNSYSQASPPTKPNLNTSISTITRDRTTDKNGQANSDFGQISIATNPATGTGDYMHQQDVNGVAKTTFRQNVPADELAKLRTGAGIPPAQQAVKESLDRMQSLAGIRKK
jgi:LysM repeat protein